MRLLTAGSLVRVQLEEPHRGIAQLVEHRSPKPSAVGSIPTAPANAAIAQSVECILGKDEVTSSNLVSSSRIIPHFTPFASDCRRCIFMPK